METVVSKPSERPMIVTLLSSPTDLHDSPPRLQRHRCRANMAHIRQSRPHSGFGVDVKVLHTFLVIPLSLGRGAGSSSTVIESSISVKILSGDLRSDFR